MNGGAPDLILVGLPYIKRYIRIIKIVRAGAPAILILIGLTYIKRYIRIIKVMRAKILPLSF